jgi:hypothetical protein
MNSSRIFQSHTAQLVVGRLAGRAGRTATKTSSQLAGASERKRRGRLAARLDGTRRKCEREGDKYYCLLALAIANRAPFGRLAGARSATLRALIISYDTQAATAPTAAADARRPTTSGGDDRRAARRELDNCKIATAGRPLATNKQFAHTRSPPAAAVNLERLELNYDFIECR